MIAKLNTVEKFKRLMTARHNKKPRNTKSSSSTLAGGLDWQNLDKAPKTEAEAMRRPDKER